MNNFQQTKENTSGIKRMVAKLNKDLQTTMSRANYIVGIASANQMENVGV